MGRSVSEIDLAPCYNVTETARGLVVRCRFCSAGWLPTRSTPAKSLIQHARKHHRRLGLILPPARLHRGMPIKVPPDVTPVRDARLDLVRVICTLHDRLVDSDGSLKDKVKETMLNKGAAFAEGDLAIAALRAGGGKSSIDARKLYRLIGDGKISLAQFLDCVSVKRKPLEQFLSGNEIDRISTTSSTAASSLYVEFKEGTEPDIDHLVQVISEAMYDAPAAKLAG